MFASSNSYVESDQECTLFEFLAIGYGHYTGIEESIGAQLAKFCLTDPDTAYECSGFTDYVDEFDEEIPRPPSLPDQMLPSSGVDDLDLDCYFQKNILPLFESPSFEFGDYGDRFKSFLTRNADNPKPPLLDLSPGFTDLGNLPKPIVETGSKHTRLFSRH